MAPKTKIEKFECEDIVAAGIRAGKSYRKIAQDCSDWAGEPISHTAVKRYVELLQGQKKEIVAKSERAVANVMHQDFDIIQTTIRAAKRIVDKFEYIDDLPEYFEERMQELEHRLVDEGINVEFLEKWAASVLRELKHKVFEIAALSKETREYMKLMADQKERIFRFELMSEFLNLFMAIYQKHSPDAFEKAVAEVSGNPRMAFIIEQQRMFNDDKGG